MSSRKQK